MAVATGTATLIAGLSAAGAAGAGAAIGSRAQSNAARQQTAAANYAADVQERTSREALDYQRQQAEEEARRYEIDRRANYDQWAARENRLGALSQMWGLGARPIPGYVPGVQSASGPAPDLSGAQAKFNELFPGETLTPDMIKAKEAELKAAGFTLRPNAAGVVGKVQYGSGPIIDVIQGAQSGVNRKQWLLPQATGAPLGSLADMARRPPPPTYRPLDPIYTAGSLRDYNRRR